jgi:G3E family GTPase
MCGLCGMFESGRRWLDAATALDPAQVRRERLRRVALVREVLKPARIAVDDFEGASFVLRGPTGRTEIVDNLFDLWRKAEALGHKALDPLAQPCLRPAHGASSTAVPVRPRDPPPLARRASARSESAEAHGAKAESGDPLLHTAHLALDSRLRGNERGESPPATQQMSARPRTASDTTTHRIPLHVLTGFLGSGKTTLLNRMLRDPSLSDSAVLINEFGAVAIDHHLIERVESGDALDLIVLKGGCACCAVRGDLVAALRELYARRADGAIPPFRRVVLETTGLADPAPVLFTLAADPALRHKFEIGAILTAVDAVHGAAQSAHHPEWLKQVAAADRIVITKTDLVEMPRVVELAMLLARTNPMAEIHDGQTLDNVAPLLAPPSPDACGRSDGAYALGSLRQVSGQTAGHTAGVDSVSIVLDEPLDWSAFAVWLTRLLHAHGDRLLRFKALLAVRDWPASVGLHAIHHLVHPPQHLRPAPGERRTSQLVFIAQGLPLDRIERSLRGVLGLVDAGQGVPECAELV